MINGILMARLGAFALVLALAGTSVFAKKDAYRFKFGLISPNSQGSAEVYLETKEIEKHADLAYAHGFSIKRKDGAQFFLYYVVRFPEPMKNLPEGIEQYYTVLEGGKALQSKEELVWELNRSFVFDKSDPVGMYEMEIYTDGELYRKIEYNVAPVPEFDY